MEQNLKSKSFSWRTTSRKYYRATVKKIRRYPVWLRMVIVVILSMVGSFAVAKMIENPRSILQTRLLNLAQEYHHDHSAVVSDKFAGTVSLTVELLRREGYDVRKFEKYQCDEKATNILIRSDGQDGYKIMDYNLSCGRF